MKTFFTSNTIRLCLAAILAAWGTYFAGELDLQSAITATVAALGGIFLRKGQGVPIAKALLLAVLVVGLTACQSPGGPLSPSQPSSSTAGQGQGAQTVGRDQGSGQTPQTVPGGQAIQTWHFAALMPFETLELLLDAAQEGAWTPETLLAAMQAASGAPHTVTISTEAMTIQGGSATATGATAGTGGGTAGSGAGPVTNE